MSEERKSVLVADVENTPRPPGWRSHEDDMRAAVADRFAADEPVTFDWLRREIERRGLLFRVSPDGSLFLSAPPAAAC